MFSTPQIKNEELTRKIFHMEDLSVDFASETYLGRKGLSLNNLFNFDVPLPEFFVLSPEVFSDFVKKVFEEKGEQILENGNPESRDILNLFHRYDFDQDLKKEILKEYTKLSGFSDAWVSVRSSVSYPLSKEVSFSGVFQTDLNIRGFNNLLKSIKSIYASLFTDSAVMYGVREGVDLSDVKLAVVIQKMVHAEVSGTCFTLDPVTLNTSNMSIEAVFGLGDVIEKGEITPDTYHLTKKNLEIYEKHISPQEWMKVRSLSESRDGFEKITISPAWSHRQKLDDKYIDEVAKISLLIEDKLNDHVDVEWAISGGRVYILQTKPAYTKNSYLSHHVQYGGYSYVSNTLASVVKDFISKKETALEMIENSMLEAKKLVEKEGIVNDIPKEEMVEKIEEVSGNRELTSGIGVSFGRAKGVVVIPKSGLETVTKENILLISKFDKSFSDMCMRAGGIVSQTGGLTSEVSLLSREFGVPAIVGVANLFDVVKVGDTVEIDGNTGAVYMIDQAKIEQVQVATEIVQKLEIPQAEVKETAQLFQPDLQNLPKTATKVYLQASGLSLLPEYTYSDGVFMVDLDELILNFGKHPAKVLEDGKYKAYAQELVVPIVNLAQAVSPHEVLVLLGSATVGKFQKLPNGTKYEPTDERISTKGVARYLKSKKSLEVAVRLIRRMRNINHCRNISLGLYAPQSGGMMKEIKKEISAGGLRRGSSFKLYAVITNPSEVIQLEDILDAEIDGIVLDTPTVAKHMFNLPLDSKNSVYDLSAGSILKIVDAVVQSTKSKEKKLTVICESNIDLCKHCITKGVFGVVVDNEVFKKVKTTIAQQEAKLILSVK